MGGQPVVFATNMATLAASLVLPKVKEMGLTLTKVIAHVCFSLQQSYCRNN
jgi:hypothetical protein